MNRCSLVYEYHNLRRAWNKQIRKPNSQYCSLKFHFVKIKIVFIMYLFCFWIVQPKACRFSIKHDRTFTKVLSTFKIPFQWDSVEKAWRILFSSYGINYHFIIKYVYTVNDTISWFLWVLYRGPMEMFLYTKITSK